MALDEDDLEKIQEMLTTGISGIEKKLPKIVNGIVELKTKGVATKDDLLELFKKEGDEDSGEIAAPKRQAAAKDDEGDGDSGEIAALKRQMAALEKQSKENAARAEAAEQARLRALRDTTIRTALDGAGVNPALRTALQHWLLGEGKVKVADDGAVVFVQPNEIGGTEEVALDAGLKGFLATEAGKAYLPPRPGNGTGDAAGSGGTPKGDAPTTRRPGDIVLGALDRLRRQG